MFLTTNRVGQFDEAFMSRIHVSIGYDLLDDLARDQIWENLFKKLKEDSEHNRGLNIGYEWDAKHYVKKEPEVKQLKWNGREIRNGKQCIIVH
jgi:ATP-dependent Clp protease ATP-binding subunit ClpA